MAIKKAIPKEIIKEVISVKTSFIAIIAVTFIAFLPLLQNSYVYWDDPQYILDNPLMHAPIKVIFAIPSGYYMWNYHPLTILVYSLEHKFFGVDMVVYHGVSLLFHLLNSVLVFFFVYYLLGKKNVLIAFITAILFGIHPMHVESVAWASELKDVMYSFFYLAALVCYVFYVRSPVLQAGGKKGRPIKYLVYAFGLYLLSLISKGQAVTLPLSFLLVDYFLKRKFTAGLITEKIPFFILSVIFGIIAIKAQSNSIVIQHSSQAFQNLFFGFYALCLYLYKFILPINLSGLYPYPNPMSTHQILPTAVYAAPIIVFVIFFIIFKVFRRDRYVMFGVLFFLANIFTVLKFIPVSEAIIADRYSYIPYIGLFFAVGYGFNKLLNNPAYKAGKKIIQYSGVALLVLLASFTWARTMVWRDSISFWGNALEEDPSYWHFYEKLGEAYLFKDDYNTAIKYFRQGVEMDKFNQDNTHTGRLNLGLCYYRKGMFDSALKVFNDIIAIDSNGKKAYYQRALVYQFGNPPKPELALDSYNKALELDPGYTDAFMSRGSLYVDQLGKYDLGLDDFNKVLQLDPSNTDAVVNTGIAYYRKGEFDRALDIYNSVAGKISDNGKIYFLEALAYAGKNDYAKALQDAEQAQRLGSTIDATLLNDWKSKNNPN